MAARRLCATIAAIGEFTVAYLLTAAVTIRGFTSFDCIRWLSVAAFYAAGLPSTAGRADRTICRALAVCLRSGADRSSSISAIIAGVSSPRPRCTRPSAPLLGGGDARAWATCRYPFPARSTCWCCVSTTERGRPRPGRRRSLALRGWLCAGAGAAAPAVYARPVARAARSASVARRAAAAAVS